MLLALFGCAPPRRPRCPRRKAKKEYKDMTLCYPQLGAESDWRTANTASIKGNR
jgi:galactofuranose transport system substrate-binding protein